MPRLELLAEKFPDMAAYPQELAASHLGLSFVLQTGGFSEEAQQAHDRAMSLYEQVAARFPNAPDPRGVLAFGYYDLGVKLGTMNQPTEADLAFRQALELYEKLVVDHPTNASYHSMLAEVNQHLALASAAANRPGEAEEWLGRALAAYERLAHAYPDVADYRARPVVLCSEVGSALQTHGHRAATENAFRFCREALERARAQFGDSDPRTARLLATLGLNLLRQQQYAEAEPLLRDCLAIREKTEPDAWTTFNARSMLGGCLLGQKKYAEAEPLLLQGYEGMKVREAKIPPGGQPRLREAVERLVQLYDWGQPKKSAQWRKKLEK